MKIIYYSPHPHLSLSAQSGYATHMREMIGAFENAGHQVLPVIACDSQPSTGGTTAPVKGGLKETIKKLIPNVLWQTLKDRSLLKFDAEMATKLEQKMQEFKPDFVYERVNYMQLSGVETCKKMGVPHISEINSPYTQEKVELEGKTLYSNKAGKLEKKLIELTTIPVTVSGALRDYLVSKHRLNNITASKFLVTHNAINPEKFSINKSKATKLTSQLSIGKNDVIIGFVGSILWWHGVDLLIKSFLEVASSNSNTKLLVVGGGESLGELKQLADKHPLGKQITFTGNVPHTDVPNYIHAMDITVIANSNWYCSPIKIFEYGVLGKVTIAPNTEPVEEVMIDGKDGIIIEPNQENLVTALNTLIESSEIREKMAVQFQKKVATNHTWNNNAQKVLGRLVEIGVLN